MRHGFEDGPPLSLSSSSRARVFSSCAASSSSSSVSAGDGGGNDAEETKEEEKLAKRVLRFVLPSLATVLSAPLLSLTDTAFVGRCARDAASSSVSLAALSQSTILCDYAPLLASFVSTAALNIVAELVARGDDEGAASATATALRLALAIGLGVAVVIFFFPQHVLRAQGVHGNVLDEAIAYCRWRALGTPLATCSAAACAALAARKDTFVPFIGVFVGALANLWLDWLAVGRGGWGVAGAAAATTASQVLGALVVIGVAGQRGHVGRASWTHARSIVRFAAPVIFVTTSVLSIFTALIVVAQRMGVVTSAAHRILGSLFSITSLTGDPLMQAVQTFLPVYLLEKNSAGARGLLVLCLSIGGAFSVVGGSLCLGIALFLPSLFTTSSACIAAIRAVLPFFTTAMVLVVPTKVLYGASIAAGDLSFLTSLVVIGTGVFMCQLLYLLKAGLGYSSLWLVLSSYYFIAFVTLSARLTAKIGGGLSVKVTSP